MRRTAITFFLNYEQAQNAVEELLELGCAPGSLRLYAVKDRPEDQQPFEHWLASMDEADRRLYREVGRQGAIAVLVDLVETAADRNEAEVLEVLRRHQPLDLLKAAEAWKDRAWHGHALDPAAQPQSLGATQPGAVQRQSPQSFPVSTGPGTESPEIQGGVRIHDLDGPPPEQAGDQPHPSV